MGRGSPTTTLPVYEDNTTAGVNARRSSNSNKKCQEQLNPYHFLFANIGGLLTHTGRVTKIPILQEDCKSENYLFIALTESHLDDTAKDAEYHIEGYSKIMSNRLNRQKGGVILYLKNNFTYKVINIASDRMCSFLTIYVNELNLAIMLAYRPPPHYTPDNLYHGQPLEQSFQNIILNNLAEAINTFGTPEPDILLLGDFNFPKAVWREGIGIQHQGISSENRMLNSLIDLCDTHNLLQKITFGTRPTQSGEENILDLLFTNNDDLLCNLSRQASALSDHYLITGITRHNFQLSSSPKTASNDTPVLSAFNLNKADWSEIRCFLSKIDWDDMLKDKSNTEIIDILSSILYEALELFCPRYKNPPGKTNYIIPRERRILFRLRKRKMKSLLKLRPGSARALRISTEILDIEQRLKDSLEAENETEESKVTARILIDKKAFYSYANKHQKIKSGVGPLKDNNQLITSPPDIAECLSTQFSSVYSEPDPLQKIEDPATFFDLSGSALPSLLDIEFTEEMVENAIDTLRANSAAGPDHISALLLKSCKKELRKPIYILWRQSLTHNDIAKIFKHAITHPVLKGNSESYLPKSYRPISLTSHLIKIFEKIVREAIVSHLINNDLLPTNQHGFLQGRSTTSQLINQTESIIRILESGSEVDTIYLDFAKAFDKVDHFILCNKLKDKRIGGLVGAWLHNFLSNRTLQVSANGALSKPATVLSGVPQGTVLGPILFIIMISDIDSNLQSSFISLFADDSRVSAISDSQECCDLLQNELNNNIYPWAQLNKAAFNGDKFEHIHFGKKSREFAKYLDPNGKPITLKPQVRDLGITISDDLTWSSHIDKIISKCRKQIAWILRIFSKRDINTMRTLWISLIRPIIDYCSPVWSPHPTNYGQIDRLEGVLRNFTKKVDNLHELPYCMRLKEMKLSSIQRRHERYKILYIYKIKEGLVPNLPSHPLKQESFAFHFHHNPRTGTKCSLPNPKLYHNPAEIARASSFALTASRLWNCLPTCISNISKHPVHTFKSKLDKFLDLLPDEPRCDASGQYNDPNTGRNSNSIWHLVTNPRVKSNIRAFDKLNFLNSSHIGEGLIEAIPHPL